MNTVKIKFNQPQMKRSVNELVLEAMLNEETPEELRYEFYKDNFSKKKLESLKDKLTRCSTKLEKLTLLKKESVNLVSFAKSITTLQQLTALRESMIQTSDNMFVPNVEYVVGKDITEEQAKRFTNWKYPCKWIDNSKIAKFENHIYMVPLESSDIKTGRPVAEYVTHS